MNPDDILPGLLFVLLMRGLYVFSPFSASFHNYLNYLIKLV